MSGFRSSRPAGSPVPVTYRVFRRLVLPGVIAVVAGGLAAVAVPAGLAPAAPLQSAEAAGTEVAAEPVLVEERTTETSSTWLQPDGSFTTEVYTTPINFSDGGEWRRIDNELVESPVAGVAVENAANDYEVRLPQDAGAKPVKYLVDGSWVSFAMRGLDGAPVVEGAEATYAAAGEADEVVYEAQPEGLKESIVLDAAPAESVVFEFDLTVSPGLVPQLRPDGRIDFTDEAGALAFVMPAPFMVDSTAPEPMLSNAVDYALSPTTAGWLLSVTPDHGWLSDPARVYPVVVDPTVTEKPAVTDCYLHEGQPSSSLCGSTTDYIRVGWASGGNARRGLLQFAFDKIPANATNLTADLELYMEQSQSTSSLLGGYVIRKVTQTWTSAATWNTRDGSVAWTPNLGGTFDSGGSAERLLSGDTSAYKAFDATSMVNDWFATPSSNKGLIVKQRVEDTDNVLGFVSSDHTNQNRWPKLVVSYSEPTPPTAVGAGSTKYFTYVTEQLNDRLQARGNVGNGNLLVSASDLSVAGVAGLDLTFDRSYNSVNYTSTGGDLSKMGPGWSHNLGGSVRLEFPNNDDKRVLFYGPSGFRVRFEKNPAGDYIRYAPGLAGNLRYHSATNTLRVELYSKTKYVFKPANDPTAPGRLVEIRDKNGNHIDFTTYNANGTLAVATDTRGRTANFTYDTNGMLASVEIRNPGGTALVRHAYTYAGSPLRLAASKVDYVNTNVLTNTTSTADVGALTKYHYDSNGRLNKVEDPRETSQTQQDPEGGTTAFDYDSAGKLWKINRLVDDTSTQIQDQTYTSTVNTFTYHTSLAMDCQNEGTHSTVVDGERTDLATAATDSTTYCSDEHDRVRRVIDAKGHVRKNTWTANSNVATFDGSGLTTGGTSFTYDYDSNDNPTRITTPTGGVSTAQYGDTTNPNFPTSMRDFDTGGATSAPKSWDYEYDDNGNLIQACNPQPATPTACDALSKTAAGRNVSYRYCWEGTGQLQRIDPIDAAGNHSVDWDENLTTGCGTTSQGNDTLYSYDTDHHVTGIDPPGAHRTTSYTYDALSRVKKITDGRGVQTTFFYDAMDRVVSQNFDITNVLGSTITVTWTYDRNGNLLEMDDPTGFTRFTYDELNRRVEQDVEAPSNTKTYRYDSADNLRHVDVSDEPEETVYTYDKVNLVISVDDQRDINADSGEEVADPKVTFDYDRHDKRIKTVFPMNGGNDLIQRAKYGDGGHLNCMYSYRANNSPVNDTQEDPACPAADASGLITFYSYDYTKAGTSLDTNTRYKVTEKGGVTSNYDYDPISRLTAATVKAGNGTTILRSFTYDYDRHSNLTKKVIGPTTGHTPGLTAGTITFAYDDAEELCWTVSGPSSNGCASPPTGATSYTHDGAGALASSSAGLAIAYNGIGQTTSINPEGPVGAIPMTYAGVTQDRRLTKDTLHMSYGFSGMSSQSTNSGVPHAEWFVRDPSGKLIAQVDRDGIANDRYYLTDAQDSIIATMTTGGTLKRYVYEPYGNQIRTWIDTNPTHNNTGSAIPPDGSQTTTADTGADHNPWRYASGFHDTETGMLKYGTRYYQPQLSRWTQTDPNSGVPQQPLTINPYLYVMDQPTGTTDPSGRFGEYCTLSPDALGFYDFHDPCVNHDECYSNIGGGWSFAAEYTACNWELYEDSYETCDGDYWCENFAASYGLGTQALGWVSLGTSSLFG